MFFLWILLPLFIILGLIIILCANTDFTSRNKKVFKDQLEEVSENMDFHVVQHAVDPKESSDES